MGFFDFLKKEELAKIAQLEKEIALLSIYKGVADTETKCQDIIAKAKERKEAILNEAEKEKSKVEDEIRELKLKQERREQTLNDLTIQKNALETQIKNLQNKIDVLNEDISLLDFGLYKPIYAFASLEEYKNKLQNIRDKQRELLRSNKATFCSKPWLVDGSKQKGEKMIKDWTKQMLRCFNNECDTLIDKVKFSNVNTYLDKIHQSANTMNKLADFMGVTISPLYIQLKTDECRLAYEYAVKKQEEKEEQRRIREQLKEEEKLQKELEQARKDIAKEQSHYNNALAKLETQLKTCKDADREELLAKKKEIEQHLQQLDNSLQDIDYREANKRAGYVYIISNIGSFGENIYKIGMTRRLEPLERVNELGDASVPFKFDVHALIFSDDAPALEASLHRAFENKKVNMVNTKREFFRVTLDEIIEEVKKNHDKTVDYTKVAEAEQYRQSIKMYEQ